MPRLIEVQLVEDCPSPLIVRVGDVLSLAATGGRVKTGRRVVDLLGAFLPAVVGNSGEVLAPEGAPNIVLVRARQVGSATMDVFTGDPWHAPRTVTLAIKVE